MSGPLAIGVDVGGTKIAAGLVDDQGRVTGKFRLDSPADDAEAMVDTIASMAAELAGGSHSGVAAVGVGAAGYVSRDRNTILGAPNISWGDVKLGSAVADKTGLPTVVENDANAAAWGEFTFGAAADAEGFVLVTVGTGVGGGIVIDGELARGSFGVAAEIGHLRVVPGGRLCGCGQHGCWEQYASGSALVANARRRVLEEATGEGLLRAAGGDLLAITGPMVTHRAQAGDLFCVDLLAEAGRWLGEGIASLAAVVDPGVVVIGGGVSAAGDLLLEPARAAFVETMSAYEQRPKLQLRLSTLGNEAGLIGAADLARREL